VANFIAVPASGLASETLNALLEEFASRDGTDYGETETPLDQKVTSLRAQLNCGELQILYDTDSEQWDLVDRESAHRLLQD
jgi:uncharacterized protein YheU (UPF0270 family)